MAGYLGDRVTAFPATPTPVNKLKSTVQDNKAVNKYLNYRKGSSYGSLV